MIKSLKDFKESSIGTQVLQERILNSDGSVNWIETDKAREEAPIFIDHKVDMVSFKMMTRPASDGGKGCQFTDLIEVALHQLKYFNNKFPCKENSVTITKLEEALMWQERRTKDRKSRGVEGLNIK